MLSQPVTIFNDHPHNGSEAEWRRCSAPDGGEVLFRTRANVVASLASSAIELHSAVIGQMGQGGALISCFPEQRNRRVEFFSIRGDGPGLPKKALCISVDGSANWIDIEDKGSVTLLPHERLLMPASPDTVHKLKQFEESLNGLPPDTRSSILWTMTQPSIELRISRVEALLDSKRTGQPLMTPITRIPDATNQEAGKSGWRSWLPSVGEAVTTLLATAVLVAVLYAYDTLHSNLSKVSEEIRSLSTQIGTLREERKADRREYDEERSTKRDPPKSQNATRTDSSQR